MTKFEHLQAGIIDLSQAQNWAEAVGEWQLADIWFSGSPQQCLCTHSPIKEICQLRNAQTGQRVEVGNCCVQRFLGLPSGTVFDALRRVRDDQTNALNSAAIAHFHSTGKLSDWERQFYEDTFKKRKLSPKQRDIRVRINKKIIAAVSRGNRQPGSSPT